MEEDTPSCVEPEKTTLASSKRRRVNDAEDPSLVVKDDRDKDETSSTTNRPPPCPSSSSSSSKSRSDNMIVLRYLEFFAGIGGWTMALQDAITATQEQQQQQHDHPLGQRFHLECCAALDHSDLCLSVYHHNHHHRIDEDVLLQPPQTKVSSSKAKKSVKKMPKKSVNIERLTLQELVDWNANLWMMSPPCQPHTRQHDNQNADLEDARSDCFLHVCDLLEQLDHASQPSLIVLENVVGFEQSKSCQRWEAVLAKSSYTVARFHLQPTQVGLPNDRPRFYSVAVKRNTMVDRADDEAYGGMSRYFDAPMNAAAIDSVNLVDRTIHSALPELGVSAEESIRAERMETLQHCLSKPGDDATMLSSLIVPKAVLERPASWCFDIVTPDSKRSSCFTSAYGKYVKGTGSVLLVPTPDPKDPTNIASDLPAQYPKFALVPPDERQYDPEWIKSLTLCGCTLRYFSGLELARLFGFPDTFSFPPNVTVKQQWKLMGNSLNVRVASKMVELGLRVIYTSSSSKPT